MLTFICFLVYNFFSATHMVELGQDRKIAALKSSMCVHFFLEVLFMYMRAAVSEAEKAFNDGNVPVGAVIVRDGIIIARAHNTKNTSNIAVYHAEILCIIDACKYLNSWYLNECDIYVTLKPCAMCINALAEARVRNVFYLLDSNYDDNLSKNREYINFKNIVDDYEYSDMLKQFFLDKR